MKIDFKQIDKPALKKFQDFHTLQIVLYPVQGNGRTPHL